MVAQQIDLPVLAVVSAELNAHFLLGRLAGQIEFDGYASQRGSLISPLAGS